MEDLEELYRLEQKCFREPWTREMLRSELENPLSVAVCERRGERLAGFALGRVVTDEAELFRIGTAEEYRGQGVARTLLERLHGEMKKNGAAVCFLEVRSRNTPALRLYEGAGYERISVRKGYYSDDDAVIMKKIL